MFAQDAGAPRCAPPSAAMASSQQTGAPPAPYQPPSTTVNHRINHRQSPFCPPQMNAEQTGIRRGRNHRACMACMQARGPQLALEALHSLLRYRVLHRTSSTGGLHASIAAGRIERMGYGWGMDRRPDAADRPGRPDSGLMLRRPQNDGIPKSRCDRAPCGQKYRGVKKFLNK